MMSMPSDLNNDDDCPVCEKCGHPMVKDAWPSTAWFCERCDDFIDPDSDP